MPVLTADQLQCMGTADLHYLRLTTPSPQELQARVSMSHKRKRNQLCWKCIRKVAPAATAMQSFAFRSGTSPSTSRLASGSIQSEPGCADTGRDKQSALGTGRHCHGWAAGAETARQAAGSRGCGPGHTFQGATPAGWHPGAAINPAGRRGRPGRRQRCAALR